MTGNVMGGVMVAATGCAASAAITVSVALAAPAAADDATFASVIIALAALFTGRRMIRTEPERPELREPKEPSVAQDPTQRRIDRVLTMVEWKKISPVEGERLIANLRAHQLPADAPVPPYGTPGGRS